jgi:hypothetical protein
MRAKSEWKSESEALRMIGTALEEIEAEALQKLGARLGGIADWPLEIGLLPARMGYAKIMIMFDLDKTKDYFDSKPSS